MLFKWRQFEFGRTSRGVNESVIWRDVFAKAVAGHDAVELLNNNLRESAKCLLWSACSPLQHSKVLRTNS